MVRKLWFLILLFSWVLVGCKGNSPDPESLRTQVAGTLEAERGVQQARETALAATIAAGVQATSLAVEKPDSPSSLPASAPSPAPTITPMPALPTLVPSATPPQVSRLDMPMPPVTPFSLSNTGETRIIGWWESPVIHWGRETFVFSPDSKILAFHGFSELSLFDTQQMTLRKRLFFPGEIQAVAFSSDANLIVVAYDSGDDYVAIELIQLDAGEVIRRLQTDQYDDLDIRYMILDPAAQTLAAIGERWTDGEEGVILEWDLTDDWDSPSTQTSFAGTSSLLSPDGSKIAVQVEARKANDPYLTNRIQILDRISGELLVTLDHGWAYGFSPGGPWFAISTGSEPAKLEIWDLNFRAVEKVIEFSEGFPEALAFLPGGEELIFVSDGDLWRLAWKTGTPEKILADVDAWQPAISPDGEILILARTWDFWWTPLGGNPELKRVGDAYGPASDFAFTAADEMLLAFRAGMGVFRSLGDGHVLRDFSIPAANEVYLSEDGTVAVSTYRITDLTQGYDASHTIIETRRTTDGSLVSRYDTGDYFQFGDFGTSGIDEIVVAGNGEVIGFSNYSGALATIYHGEIRILRAPDYFESSTEWTLALSSDGELLAAGDLNGTLWLWKLNGSVLMPVRTLHTAQLISIAFSPDGKRIVSADDSGRVLVWEVGPLEGDITALSAAAQTALFEMKPTLPVYGSVNFYELAFSPDGSLLAGEGAGFLWFWDGQTGAFLSRTEELPIYCERLRFSPDGKFLVMGGFYGVILILGIAQ